MLNESYTSHGSNLKKEELWKRRKDLLTTLIPTKFFSELHDIALTSKLCLNFLLGICRLAAQVVMSFYASEINHVTVLSDLPLTRLLSHF